MDTVFREEVHWWCEQNTEAHPRTPRQAGTRRKCQGKMGRGRWESKHYLSSIRCLGQVEDESHVALDALLLKHLTCSDSLWSGNGGGERMWGCSE